MSHYSLNCLIYGQKQHYDIICAAATYAAAATADPLFQRNGNKTI